MLNHKAALWRWWWCCSRFFRFLVSLSEWRVYITILITWRYFGGFCFGFGQFLQYVTLYSVTNTQNYETAFKKPLYLRQTSDSDKLSLATCTRLLLSRPVHHQTWDSKFMIDQLMGTVVFPESVIAIGTIITINYCENNNDNNQLCLI